MKVTRIEKKKNYIESPKAFQYTYYKYFEEFNLPLLHNTIILSF